MKRLFLFFVLFSLLMNSCSHDDNDDLTNPTATENVGTLSVKIDGKFTVFDDLIVTKRYYSYENENYTYLTVTATRKNNPSEIISFVIRRESNEIYGLTYVKNGVVYGYYQTISDDFYYVDPGLSGLTVGTDHKLIGKFSGKVWGNIKLENGEYPVVALTDASFNINYGYDYNLVVDMNIFKFKVGGVEKVFTNLEVQYFESVDLVWVHGINDDSYEEFSCYLNTDNIIGLPYLRSFMYRGYGSIASNVFSAFKINNNDRKLIGIFMGPAYRFNMETQKKESIVITDGYFQIAY